jgi:hypothetical protein
MIISHQHKFIFLKTQKTAGTSIEIALSEICGAADIITPISPEDENTRQELGYVGPGNTRIPLFRYNPEDWYWRWKRGTPIHYYNHAPARKIKQWADKHVWEKYFKFSIERNPWDKVISHYYWKGGDDRFGSIANYLESRVLTRIKGERQYAIKGKVVADKIYQFEDLPGMLHDLSDRFKLNKKLELPTKKAKSGVRKDKRHYRDILADQEVERVQELFADEIRRFNYQF